MNETQQHMASTGGVVTLPGMRKTWKGRRSGRWAGAVLASAKPGWGRISTRTTLCPECSRCAEGKPAANGGVSAEGKAAGFEGGGQGGWVSEARAHSRGPHLAASGARRLAVLAGGGVRWLAAPWYHAPSCALGTPNNRVPCPALPCPALPCHAGSCCNTATVFGEHGCADDPTLTQAVLPSLAFTKPAVNSSERGTR